MKRQISGNYLFVDLNFTHKVESSNLEDPKEPLSKKEREKIERLLLKKCTVAYVKKFRCSGLKSSAYDISDLKQDAWIHLQNIMNKFDKAAYPSESIGLNDIEGSGNQKTIEWYFYNYYCRRLNLTVKENVEIKKTVSGGDYPCPGWLSIDSDKVEDRAQSHSELADIFKEELALQPLKIREFIELKMFLGIPLNELKKIYSDFRSLNEKSRNFINSFREQHLDFIMK